ncbi:MAG: hypothetical protein MUO72_09745 [Bacteroidales bacterium]|nr:hypothetical protein [Bacteroidales bacterium]
MNKVLYPLNNDETGSVEQGGRPSCLAVHHRGVSKACFCFYRGMISGKPDFFRACQTYRDC